MHRYFASISVLAISFAAMIAATPCEAAAPWWPGIPRRSVRKAAGPEPSTRPYAPRVNKYVIVDPAPYQAAKRKPFATRDSQRANPILPAAGAASNVQPAVFHSPLCRRPCCTQPVAPIFEPIARLLPPLHNSHDALWSQHALTAAPYPWGWFGAKTHPVRSGKTSIRGLYRDSVTSPGN